MIVEAKNRNFNSNGYVKVLKDYDTFEWDENKSIKTYEKRKFGFELVTYIFENVRAERDDYGEDHFDPRDQGQRCQTIGKAKNQRGEMEYYFVDFIEVSDSKARIISARVANKDERRIYNYVNGTI